MYVEYRDDAGKAVRLPVEEGGEPITIGRNPNSSIHVQETSVSRNHGRIGHDGRGVFIRDLGSSNGTWVNGERRRRAQLSEGDVIRFGEVFEVHVLGGSAPGGDGSRPRPRPAAEQSSRPRRPTGASPAMNAPAGSEGGAKPAQATRRKERRPQPTRARVDGKKLERMRETGRGGSLEVPGKPRPVARSSGRLSTDKAAAALQRRVAELEAKLADAEDRARSAEQDARQHESRAMRYTVELDGLSDKYVKLKENNQVISRSLEETREELREREDDAFEAERKVTELEAELEKQREKATEATEQLSGLKVRLTQRDRQIEELQRQLDLLEYELRAQREEMDSLQSNFNREGGDVERLERKVNLLQEVIQEKESLIEQLRIDLRDKDIEIRQVRMGVGISDLEHEKRQLLQDYHNATRRVDELNDRYIEQTRQLDALKDELAQARAEAGERRPTVPADISDHPDFKAKVREIERLREELQQTQRDLARAELKLEEAVGQAEGAGKLAGELEVLRRKNESLESRLAETDGQLGELRTLLDAAPGHAVPSEELLEDLEALTDAADASRSNARLVRRYAEHIERDARAATDDAATEKLRESVEMVVDTAVVLAQDLSEQARLLTAVRQRLGAERDDAAAIHDDALANNDGETP